MPGFANIRKTSYLKKDLELSVSSGNEEAEPDQKTKQIRGAKEQDPYQRADESIIEKKIHLGLRPSSQRHAREVFDAYCLPQIVDHQRPNGEPDG